MPSPLRSSARARAKARANHLPQRTWAAPRVGWRASGLGDGHARASRVQFRPRKPPPPPPLYPDLMPSALCASPPCCGRLAAVVAAAATAAEAAVLDAADATADGNGGAQVEDAGKPVPAALEAGREGPRRLSWRNRTCPLPTATAASAACRLRQRRWRWVPEASCWLLAMARSRQPKLMMGPEVGGGAYVQPCSVACGQRRRAGGLARAQKVSVVPGKQAALQSTKHVGHQAWHAPAGQNSTSSAAAATAASLPLQPRCPTTSRGRCCGSRPRRAQKWPSWRRR